MTGLSLRSSLLSLALCTTASGCGAMINGTRQSIEIKATDPKARILQDGTVVGTGGATVSGSPAAPPIVFVEDSQGNIARYVPESRVSATAIILDGLWCLTIIGVAAPISDALMGTFSGLVAPSQPIGVPQGPPRTRRVEYAVPAAAEPAPSTSTLGTPEAEPSTGASGASQYLEAP